MADEELLNIINIIKKYDVYDVITRLASLNLLVENQNSAILLDALIAEILHAENLPGSTVKMSQGRFKKIVKELNSTSLNQFIDPVENPFIQNVMAYGNYKVFNGIDLVTAYNVQALGRVLSNQEKYPKEFIRKSWKLITFCLQVSDYIAERVGTVQSKKIEREYDGLIVPDAPTMSRYIELITIRGEFVRTLFQNDSDIIENSFDNFRPKIKDNIDNRTFYTRPFLFNEHKDEIILLNIALLPTYLVYSVLRLANQFGIKEQVIEDYNTYIFYDCKKYLKRLGHEKIKEQQFHIELSKDTTHREEVLNIHNNQFLILIYLCDDGDNYNSDSLHEVYNVKISDEEKRMLSIRKCLIDNHIPEEDIFYLLIVNEGLGRTISSSITSLNNIKYIQLSPFDLYCVSVNENSNPGFIPRYINAKFASGISIL